MVVSARDEKARPCQHEETAHGSAPGYSAISGDSGRPHVVAWLASRLQKLFPDFERVGFLPAAAEADPVQTLSVNPERTAILDYLGQNLLWAVGQDHPIAHTKPGACFFALLFSRCSSGRSPHHGEVPVKASSRRRITPREAAVHAQFPAASQTDSVPGCS